MKNVKGIVFVLNQDFISPVSNWVKVGIVQMPNILTEDCNE